MARYRKISERPVWERALFYAFNILMPVAFVIGWELAAHGIVR